MSKLDDYKRLSDHIKISSTSNHLTNNFPGGFGQFTELLLSDNINSWAPSNQPYFNIVQEIKKEFIQSNRLSQFESLKNSLLTSFYTPEQVCKTIIDSLPIDRLQPISVLEPAAGTGNFVRPLTKTFPNASITAIEKDPTAFSLLATIQNTETLNIPFEQFDSNSKYDLIISNIPFGNFKVYNKEHANSKDIATKKSLSKIHNFFFVRSMKLLSDNGSIAFIAPSGFADSLDNQIFREHLVNQANLIFFNRLPIQTFKEAGTKASSDLLIFQKDPEKKQALGYEQNFITSHKRQQTNINGLLVKHGRLGLGIPELGGQYGNKTLQYNFQGSSENIADELAERLSSAWRKQKLLHIDKSIPTTKKPEVIQGEEKDKRDQTYLDCPEYYQEGNLAINENDVVKLKSKRAHFDDSFFDYQVIENLPFHQTQQIVEIRDLYKRLVIAETTDKKDPEPLRKQLDEKYTHFTSFYGNLNSKSNIDIIHLDSEAHKLYALELSKDGQYIKAEIFTQRISGVKLEIKVESLSDAIAHSLNKFNKINLTWMADQLGRKEESITQEAIESELLFFNPIDKSQFQLNTKDTFLSGDVILKQIALNKQDHSNFPPLLKQYLELHQEKINEIQPTKIPLELLYIKVGERWIDETIYEKFAKQLFGTTTSVNYLKSQDKYVIELSGYSADSVNKYSCSAGSRGFYQGTHLLEFAMVDYQPTITKKIKENNVIDEAKMKEFAMKTDLIKREFESFILKDETTRKYIEDKYHRLFNNIVLREYDGSHQKLDNLQHFLPRDHQKNTTWRLILIHLSAFNRPIKGDEKFSCGQLLFSYTSPHYFKTCILPEEFCHRSQ